SVACLFFVRVAGFLLRFSVRCCTALSLALSGLWLLIRPSSVMNRGDLYTLVCAVAFALHIILVEAYVRRSDVLSFSAWQLVMVAGALVGPALMEGYRPWSVALTPTLLWALVIMVVLASALAFCVQVWAQQHVPAPRVALIFALE